MAQVPSFGMPRDAIKEELERIRHPFRIAIRRSKNPFNVGAILRTAHSFLAKEILLIGDEDWYERAAMGMHRYENVIEIASEAELVRRAKEEGWFLSALEKDCEREVVSLWDAALPEGAVIVIGNEDEGVGPELLAAADEVIAIPMFGINHSYPMTVAAGIAMAEWARRRYAGPGRVVVTPR
ncbi:MAG: TrmH family RNA methyltransferase [Sandaracinaceae bacterium]|nr:TrmH family RNA methyltransferase [Sandaracinaceae bacterium]